MSEHDPTEDRLRRELHAIGEPPVDVERVLDAGLRRARRRDRGRAAAGAGMAGLAVIVAIAVLPDDAANTVTDSPTDPSSTTAAAPPEVPLGENTTWPGGPFDPIDGMVAVPGAEPLSPEEGAAIYDAEQRLTAACMEDQGYESSVIASREWAGAPPLYLSPDELRAGGFDYDYDWAAAGEEFLDLSDGSPEGSSDPTAGMTREERDAYEAASSGTEDFDVQIDTHDGTTATSSGGCVGESRAWLYGSVANSLRYGALVEPFADLSDQLREHEEYEQPLADWKACMGDAGFDVGDHDYGADFIRQAGAAALSTDGPRPGRVHGRDDPRHGRS